MSLIEELKYYCKNQADHHKQMMKEDLRRNSPLHAGFNRAYLDMLEEIERLEEKTANEN